MAPVLAVAPSDEESVVALADSVPALRGLHPDSVVASTSAVKPSKVVVSTRGIGGSSGRFDCRRCGSRAACGSPLRLYAATSGRFQPCHALATCVDRPLFRPGPALSLRSAPPPPFRFA